MEVGPKGARIPVGGQNGPEGSAGGCALPLDPSSGLAAFIRAETAAGLRARPNGHTLESWPSQKQLLAPAAAVVGPSIDPNAAAALTGGPNLGSAQTGPASGAGQPQLGSNAGSMASGPNQGNNGGAAAGQPGPNVGAGGAGMSGGMGNSSSGQGIDTGELRPSCLSLNVSDLGAGLSVNSRCTAAQPEEARLTFSASSDPKNGHAGSQSRGSNQETPGTGGRNQATDSARREPSTRSHGSEGGMVRATEAPTGEAQTCPQCVEPASLSAIGTGCPAAAVWAALCCKQTECRLSCVRCGPCQIVMLRLDGAACAACRVLEMMQAILGLSWLEHPRGTCRQRPDREQ